MSKNNIIEQPSADDDGESRRKKPKPKQGTCRTTKPVTTSNTDELSGDDGESQTSSDQKSKRGTGRTNKPLKTSNTDGAQVLSGNDGDGKGQTPSQSSSHQKSKRGTGRPNKTTTTSNNDSAQDLSGDDGDGENQTSSQSSSHQKSKRGTGRTKTTTTSNNDSAQDLSGDDGDGENQTSSQSSSHQKSKRGTGRTKPLTTSNTDGAQVLSGDDGDKESQTSSRSSSHQKSKRGTGRTKTITTSNTDDAQVLSGDDGDKESQTSYQSSSHHKSKRGTGRTNQTVTITLNSTSSKSKKRGGDNEEGNEPKKPKKDADVKSPEDVYKLLLDKHGDEVKNILIGKENNKYENPLHFVGLHFISACSHSSLRFKISDAQWFKFDVHISKEDRIKGLVNTQEHLIRLHSMYGGTFPNLHLLRIPSPELGVIYVSPEAQGGVRKLTAAEEKKKAKEQSSSEGEKITEEAAEEKKKEEEQSSSEGQENMMHTQNTEKAKRQKKVKQGYYRVTTSLDFSKDVWCDEVTTSNLDEKHAEVTELVDDWICTKGHCFKKLVSTLFGDMNQVEWDTDEMSADDIKTRFAEICVRFEGLHRHICTRLCEHCFKEITGSETFEEMEKYWKFIYKAMSLFRTYRTIDKDTILYTTASGFSDIQMEEHKTIESSKKLSKEKVHSGKLNKEGHHRIVKDRSEKRAYNPKFFHDRIRIMEETGVFCLDKNLRFNYAFAEKKCKEAKEEKKVKKKVEEEMRKEEEKEKQKNEMAGQAPESEIKKKIRRGKFRTELLVEEKKKEERGQQKLDFKSKNAHAERPKDPEKEDESSHSDNASNHLGHSLNDSIVLKDSDDEKIDEKDKNAQADQINQPELLEDEDEKESDVDDEEDEEAEEEEDGEDDTAAGSSTTVAQSSSKKVAKPRKPKARDDSSSAAAAQPSQEVTKQREIEREPEAEHAEEKENATAEWDDFLDKLNDFLTVIHGSFIRLKETLGQDAEKLILTIEKHHKKSYELIATYQPSLRSGGAPPNAKRFIKQTEELIATILRETESLQNEGKSTIGKEEIDNKAVDLLRKIIEFQLKN